MERYVELLDRYLTGVAPYLLVFAVALLTALLATPAAARIAIRLRIVDRPNARKIHRVVKPLLGGLAIYVAFIGVLLGWMLLVPPDPDLRLQLQGLIFGATFILGVGLYDDIKGLSVRDKFIGQIIAAIILYSTGTQVVLFIGSPVVAFALTVLWVVAITNSFNLLDNMDGLSAGVAVIATWSFFLVFVGQSQVELAVVACILGGACLGFLRYNFPPARIFMGDAGSMLLGFILAALAVMGNYLKVSRLTHLPVIIPFLILSIPIFDTLSVMVLRRLAGISIFTADRRHFSHRLVNLGMTIKQAVLTIYLLAFAIGLTATLLPQLDPFEAVLILMHTLILFTVIVLLERASANQQERRNGPVNGDVPPAADRRN